MKRLLTFLCLVAATARAQDSVYLKPFPAYQIADNLYFVGSAALGNFLITTPRGHILINSDFEANVPGIRASVESLGFKFTDIRILLISHAHGDHAAGSALIKKLTGAQYMVMEGDVPVVESGGALDFHYGADSAHRYPVTKVDRILHDGDTVRLGDAALVAHLTPGHTKGTTTWTMKAMDHGTLRDVVIIGSPNVNEGFRLVGNTKYSSIAEDYERGFEVLKAMPCEIFLGAHGGYFGMAAKYERFKSGDTAAFIDPAGCRTYITNKERAFRAELGKQRATPLP